MANILANTKADGAVVLRYYKSGVPEDRIIGSRMETTEQLKISLFKALTEIGTTYKPKYEKKLLKALGRGK